MADTVETRTARLREITTRLLKLGEDKRHTFLEWLEQQGIPALQLPIVPGPARDGAPLSYAQQRLWLIEQLHPGGALYNVHSVLRLEGALDVGALRQAISGLIERHEVLRTSFEVVDGAPRSRVEPAGSFSLGEVDLSSEAPQERARRIAELSEREASTPFDLTRAPLVRATLVRCAPREHRLLITMHHIAFDEWSDKVLTEEFVQLYTAAAAGASSPLPPLPLQYADYARWQRSVLTGPVLASQLDYWTRQLGTGEHALDLPFDFPRPAAPSHAGASVAFELPPELFQRLAAFGKTRGLTPFMLVLAAFHVLLARYTGQRDLRVGVPIAGRSRSELEGLIGFFSNTQVLRTEVDLSRSVDAYLGDVQRVVADAQSHQDLPFEQLVDALAPERRLNQSPLFEVMLSWHRAGEGAGQAIAGLEVHSERTAQRIAKFDLSLHVTELPSTLHAELNYRTERFRAETLERMGRHLVRLLGALCEDGSRPLAALEWLSHEERAEALALACPRDREPGARAAEEPLPVHVTIQRALEQGAPEAEALRGDDAVLGRAELEAHANRVARFLRARGVGPEARVALCLPRGAELVVWLYGVLKTGAAYVPLDPRQPEARLDETVADAGAALVIAEEARADAAVPWLAARAVRELPLDGEAVSVEVSPESAAYVIYTSGSTGKPKGVVVTHRGLASYVRALLMRLELPAEASLALVSTVAADLGNTVLFGALCSGRPLHVLSEALAFDADQLGEYFERHAVGVLKIVPSHLSGLILGARPERVLPRHALVLGGERSDWELVERVASLGRCRIFNHYGPTETTVGVLAGEARPAARATSASLPLGTPLDNSRVYVLGPDLSLVPRGIVGEVFIGGEGVARGYLERPELTADRFVPDRFAGDGARLYRTGDRARHLPDGTLEFLGRSDEQVKIRGHRVELAEIRAELLALPGVDGAEVVARAGAAGQTQLIAYLVGAGAQAPDASALAAALARRLPEHMLPSDYVWLERFPLTPNGKLDRRALPEPGPRSVAARRAPSTPQEAALASVWREVLKIEAVGVDDNFFAIGGDSLLAFQVIALARQTGLPLSVHALFEHQTIAELARSLGDAEAGAESTPEAAPKSQRIPRAPGERAPLSFSQQRLWFLWRLEPDSSAYNVPRAVRLRGALDVGVLRQTFAALSERHEVLRTRFVEHDGQPYQIVDPPRAPELPIVDLGAEPDPEHAARERAEAAALTPFDLERGPLLRLELLRLGEHDHVLLFGMHHIVSDGWSTTILIEELAELYGARRAGREPELAPLPIQYRDYAAWQRGQGAEALERQLEYWKQQLGSEHPVLALPADRPRPATWSARGGSHRFVIGKDQLAALRAFAQERQVTLFMLLLAAFKTLLFRHSQQSDLRVGVPSAGRGRPEVEPLIGFFVNTHVIKTEPKPEAPFTQYLDEVRRACLGAQAHPDLPFERLVEALNPERSASHGPLFQVQYNHQRRDLSALDQLQGLELEEFSYGTDSAQVDLALETFEEPDALHCSFTYARDLFHAERVERWAQEWVRLLAGVVAEPTRRLSALSLWSDAERRRVLEAWNATEREYPREPSVAVAFEGQARRSPQALAVVSGDAALSYAELDARAGGVARRLWALGLAREDRVAVCLERGVDLLAVLLGVWKAGGAYVPLDPSYPRERLELMREDAAPRVIVTQSSLAEALPVSASSPVWCIDAEGEPALEALERTERALAAERALRRQHHPDQIAYCLYTSGSTGRPKGVAVSHGALSNFLHSMREEPGLSAADRVLALTSLSFDIAGLELYLPLLVGAAVVLVSRAEATDPRALLEVIERHGVTLVQATPATWRMLTEAAAPGQLARCKKLCGGEALPSDLAEGLLAAGGRVWNVYGPTETTIWSSVYELGSERREPLLGHPIANTRLYVLDATLSPVPVGAPGEVYIGGAGLARGYLGRPELTAERFVPSPFSQSGERLYRTGDLGRYRDSGVLEYLGRVDHQVKIRGHRIELGEIEARLLEHGAVKQAVVVARGAAADARLVAYVVPSAAAGSDAELTASPRAHDFMDALRAQVAQHLPEYMLPAHYVLLERLPLTPNGKVDRKALPAPDASALQKTYEAPRGAFEQALAAIWAELLGAPRVGRSDHFFELGGHSLLATQVVARVARRLGREVPLRALFEAGELWRFAERVASAPFGKEGPALVPVERSTPLPLSFAQQRQWVLWKLDPESSAYHIPAAARLSGALDRAALEASFTELLARQESLRTRFVSEGDEPRQVIDAPGAPPLSWEDLRALPEAEREPHARQRVEEEAQAPFDLEQGPLWRARVLTLSEREHVLLVTLHHAISDAQSMTVLVEELCELYAARVEGREPRLPPLAVQYADYAVWQRRWLEAGELERQLEYWRAQLGGEHPLLELPSDRPRPAVQSYRGAMHAFELEPELVRQLRRLGEARGASLFMVLLAAFDALLHRCSGQSQIRVGVPSANRNREEIERAIGFFVDTHVHAVEVRGEQSFERLLEQVREAALGAQAHQDLPFERLVEALNPERSTSHSPLFQVMYNHQARGRGASVALPGLTLTALERERRTSAFDLTLDVREDASDRLYCSFTYAEDLFDPARIERLARHWARLLAEVAARPERRLSALSLWSEAERLQVLEAWNATARDYAIEPSVASAIEAQVRMSPNAVAVVSGDAALSYAALEARARGVARRLWALGVQAEGRVAVCLERGAELLSVLFGVWKAGAAYVPLDPSYPRERLQWMVEDAAPRVLVTQTSLLGALPASAARVWCIDAEGEPALEALEQSPRALSAERALEAGRHRDRIAYCLYTSGSTGRPKGVAVSHGALANFLCSMREEPGLSASDRVLALTSLSFDIAGLELYLPLVTGATVVLVSRAEAADPRALLEVIERQGVTLVQATPSTWRMLTEAAAPGQLARCKKLCGGEALPGELAERLLEAGGRVWNVYGPTETTIWSSVYELGAERREPLLGSPIANTQLYVLDATLSPVPVGTPGEVYIGGAGLARGYSNRPDATAERFVPSPFSERGERLYRTGDLGRYREGGALEYLGRVDHQVKIRGHRIELGEIEARLSEHAAVKQAVVMARAEAGDARLVAYVVPSAGVGSDADAGNAAEPTGALRSHDLVDALRAQVAEQLPEYMLPAQYVLLERLPLTPNGKVDRKALPAPDASALQKHYEPPRGALEQALAAIWAELLGLERVGRSDHFFELGGHSLLATQVVSRVARRLGRDVPLRALFEASELWRFAERVAQAPLAVQGPALVPVERSGPLPLSYAQQRSWVLWKIDPESGAYNIPAAVRLRGALDVGALEQSFSELTARHESLRTRFVSQGAEPRQLIEPARPVALAQEDLRALPAAEREERARQRAEEEAQQPFDLEQGPLWRVKLLVLDEREHVLLVTLHHAISDAQSMTVLVEELCELYAARVEGREPRLPPLAVQYADYAVWQRQWLEAGELERQLEYWRARLGSAHPLLELGSDRPRPALQSYAGASHGFALDAELGRALRKLGEARGATVFMVLLAAFDALLFRYSGQSPIRVGVPSANRRREEIERAIGFFVNTQVYAVEVRGEQSFEQLLDEVREAALGAQAHQDLPFERLVEALNPERSASHSPLFQVMYNHQAAERAAEVALPGLTLGAFERASRTSPFDLVLESAEGDDGRLVCSFTYATALFDRERIAELAASFQQLLAHAAREPEQLVDELALGVDAQRDDSVAPRARATAPRAFTPVTALVAEHARRRPEAPALACGDERLSYGALEAQSTALAHALVARGVAADTVVGVCVERSCAMVVTLLAVLEAGAAFVPLDPAAPAARTRQIVDDAGVRLVVGHAALLERLALPPQRERLALESVLPAAAAPSAALPQIAPGQLAYVIYTSGSSGTPKGVAVEHGSLSEHLQAMAERVGLGEDDRSLCFAALSFDAAVEQWLLPLCTGGELVITGAELWSPERMLEEIDRARLTRLDLPPLYLVELARQARERGRTLGVRSVTVGGEALPSERLPLLFEALGDAELYNAYGPTEAVITPLVWRAERGPCESRFAPIGTPVGARGAYVLDRRLRPVPPGAVGELYLSGLLARGYHARPELTAQGFVPSPFGAGERWYRTGDRARRRRDGSFEYVGRADAQVKLRGYRIELGEVEAALRRHAWVSEAAVAVHQGAERTPRLVGYVVLAAHARPLAAIGAGTLERELERHLAQSLPDYMLPRLYVTLDALPLLPSGKLDRRALPAPDERELSEPFTAPAAGAEAELAAIWAELLKLERVGARDNFFELGGDSIVALQVVGKARQHGLVLSPKQLFQHQTVRDLARVALPLGAPAGALPLGEPAGAVPLGAPAGALPLGAPAGAVPLGAPKAGVSLSPSALDPAQVLERLGVPREDLEDVYPMTPMQQGLMLHSLVSQGSGVYHMQAVFRIGRGLDERAFHAAWRRVVDRHPMLRTAFRGSDETGPVQLVYRQVPDPSALVVWPALAADEQALALERHLASERARGFDLSEPRSFHVRLIRVGPEPLAEGQPAPEATGGVAYYAVASNHHILMDDWCMSLLWQDFFACYEACRRGEEPSANRLPPFSRYVEWLGKQDQALARDYWRRELSGLRYPTPLPFQPLSDEDELANRDVRDQKRWLDEESTEALRRAARRHGLTPNTFVQAAWAWVLAEHAGLDEVLFGVIAAGRPMEIPDVDSIVGLFIQAIPLRVRLAREQSVAQWLSSLLAKNAELRDYEYLPLTDIRQVSEIRGQSLFHSLFVFENAPFDAGLARDAERFDVEMLADRTHTNYPITVVVYPGRRLGLHLSYNGALFSEAEMELLLRQLKRALEALVHGVEQPLGALSFVTPEEHAWRRAQHDNARPLGEASFVERFEAIVDTQPERVAASELERTLTYAELDRKSNRVAHALIAAGVGPEDRVALLSERGLELLAAVLGTFKAAAVYVPLDPRHPPQRLSEVLASSEPRAVLAPRALGERLSHALALLPNRERPTLVWLDALEPSNNDGVRPGRSIQPDQLAYVIYTSGSTGTPKGVMVPHRGMLNNQLGKLPYLGLGAHDTVAQTASQCFDISVWQLLTPLLVGGRVDIVPDAIAHDPVGLFRHVAARKVTVLESVPSLIQSALGSEGLPAPAELSLRWLLPTGEALPVDVARGWLERYPGVPLVNAYGPAECSDDVSLHTLAQPPALAETGVPIGRAVDNTELWVLDSALSVVPFGVTGELCVAGVGVGRGYLGDPARTAERFVPHPFGAPGARLYRTGDLCRQRPDGLLEFVGRVDHQVKLRGYRIELGEIEARLLADERVAAAAVVARERAPGDRRLVAYVVPSAAVSSRVLDAAARDSSASAPVDAELAPALRTALAQSLPEYMLPSAFVLLDALPLGNNGKLDRDALPLPEWQTEQRAYLPPETPTEQLLASLWQELLGVERVGKDDDFTELGGHSLLAVRMMQAAGKRLGKPLALSLAFRFQQLSALARAIDARPSAESLGSLVPLAKEGRGSPVYFLHPAGGHLLSYRPLVERLRGPRPLYGLQARSFYLEDWIDESIPAMAEHYASEIERCSGKQRVHLVGWSFGGLLAVEVARACRARAIPLGTVALIDSTDVLGDSALGEALAPAPRDLAPLTRWIASAHLRAKWQRLLDLDDPSVNAFLLSHFTQRELAQHELDYAQESELFNAANCVILTRDYRLEQATVPVQAFWATETLAEEGVDPAKLEGLVAVAATHVIEGDHDSIVQSEELMRVLEGLIGEG